MASNKFEHSGNLRYWDFKNNVWISISEPSKATLEEALKILPPGSAFVCISDSNISKLIGFWGLLTHLWDALIRGFKVMYSHAGLYFGSGDRETVEAFAKGVGIGDFDTYLNTSHRVQVWYNNTVTIDQLQLLKEFAYQQVGKAYDYAAFLHFIFKRLQPTDQAFICTELVAASYNTAKIPFLTKDPADIQPIDVVEYLEKTESYTIGWRKLLEWGY